MRGVWGGESENHENRYLASTQCVVRTLYVMCTLYQLSLTFCMKSLYVAPTLGKWGGGDSLVGGGKSTGIIFHGRQTPSRCEICKF